MLIPNTQISSASTAVWNTYVPVLTGSISDPTLGSGSENYGNYIQIGSIVFYTVRFQVGGAGFVNGSGDVICSLPPVAMHQDFWLVVMVMGAGNYIDTSGGDGYAINPYGNSASTVKFRLHSTNASVLSYTNIVAWAANDELAFQGHYKVA